MKILIVCQYFYPEEFKVNDVVEEFVKKGHEVTVITGKPNYPKGEYFAGYGFWGVNKEEYKGAKVIRIPLINRGKGGALGLLMNFFSFPLIGSLYVKTHKIEVDRILCYQLSPVMMVYPALSAKKRTKAPLSLWIQDLWPESVSAASNIHNKVIMNRLGNMVCNIYKRCDHIFMQSGGFINSISQKGVTSDKVSIAYNWADDSNLTVVPDKAKYSSLIPKGFVVMFAGNIGEAQDFDNIVKAAELTKEFNEIKWVVVGDGRYKTKVEKMITEKQLDNFYLLGRFPSSEMPNFYIHADVMLLTLTDAYIFSLTIPSKTQSYMSFGKPIVTMINGEANNVVNNAKCGLTSNSGDYKTLSDNIISLYKGNPDRLKSMGENGRLFYMENFDKNKVIDSVMSILENQRTY